MLCPPGWPRPRGYAHGVVAEGRMVFVAGQVGWDANERLVGEVLASQARQALANTVAILAAGGAAPRDIVRMTWYVTDKREYLAARPVLNRVYRDLIGAHYPAMTVVEVAGLIEPGAKVEIETTAVVPADRWAQPTRNDNEKADASCLGTAEQASRGYLPLHGQSRRPHKSGHSAAGQGRIFPRE